MYVSEFSCFVDKIFVGCRSTAIFQIHENLALENFGYTVVDAWCHVKIRVTRMVIISLCII